MSDTSRPPIAVELDEVLPCKIDDAGKASVEKASPPLPSASSLYQMERGSLVACWVKASSVWGEACGSIMVSLSTREGVVEGKGTNGIGVE